MLCDGFMVETGATWGLGRGCVGAGGLGVARFRGLASCAVRARAACQTLQHATPAPTRAPAIGLALGNAWRADRLADRWRPKSRQRSSLPRPLAPRTEASSVGPAALDHHLTLSCVARAAGGAGLRAAGTRFQGADQRNSAAALSRLERSDQAHRVACACGAPQGQRALACKMPLQRSAEKRGFRAIANKPAKRQALIVSSFVGLSTFRQLD